MNYVEEAERRLKEEQTEIIVNRVKDSLGEMDRLNREVDKIQQRIGKEQEYLDKLADGDETVITEILNRHYAMNGYAPQKVMITNGTIDANKIGASSIGANRLIVG